MHACEGSHGASSLWQCPARPRCLRPPASPSSPQRQHKLHTMPPGQARASPARLQPPPCTRRQAAAAALSEEQRGSSSRAQDVQQPAAVHSGNGAEEGDDSREFALAMAKVCTCMCMGCLAGYRGLAPSCIAAGPPTAAGQGMPHAIPGRLGAREPGVRRSSQCFPASALPWGLLWRRWRGRPRRRTSWCCTSRPWSTGPASAWPGPMHAWVGGGCAACTLRLPPAGGAIQRLPRGRAAGRLACQPAPPPPLRSMLICSVFSRPQLNAVLGKMTKEAAEVHGRRLSVNPTGT